MKDLNNTWCEATEEKPKNNFKDYGFEAGFEGEILKESLDRLKRKIYIGYYIGDNDVHYPCIWDSLGYCDFCCSAKCKERRLKPIKKEWYENPDNFPCIVLDRNYNMFLAKGIDIDNFLTQEFNKQIGHIKHFRPATKEEVLTLLVKE